MPPWHLTTQEKIVSWSRKPG